MGLCQSTTAAVVAHPRAMGGAECSICLEDVVEPVLMRCGHAFHGACITAWAAAATAAPPACPLCRAPMEVRKAPRKRAPPGPPPAFVYDEAHRVPDAWMAQLVAREISREDLRERVRQRYLLTPDFVRMNSSHPRLVFIQREFRRSIYWRV